MSLNTRTLRHMDPAVITYDHIVTLLLSVIGVLAGLGGFMLKKLVERVQTLENDRCDTITRKEARAIVDDKITPLRAQIASCDAKLDLIIGIMMSGKNDGDK